MVRETMFDGGIDLDDAIDRRVGDDADHALRHVTAQSWEYNDRHQSRVETRVDDDALIPVHIVNEEAAADAHDDSLSWDVHPPTGACPFCNGDVDRERETTDRDDDAGVEKVVETFECDTCPFAIRRASKTWFDDTGRNVRPLWYRACVPVDFDFYDDGVAGGVTWDNIADDTDDLEGVANVARRIELSKYTTVVNDAAWVSPEYEGEGDDREKVADGYVDTIECGRCGDVVDAPAKKSHPHFGDVCPDCEDVDVWSADDADLPDDVADALSSYKSVTPAKVRDLLRDVVYWSDYIVESRNKSDDGGMFTIARDDVDPADVDAHIHTGRQGRHATGRGDRGKPGTGLRRPHGAAHKDRYWRNVVDVAKDTGLIRRIDDHDVDDDAPNATWEATDKGRDVLDALARCRHCGDALSPVLNVYGVKISRHTSTKNFDLRMVCPECDDVRGATHDLRHHADH